MALESPNLPEKKEEKSFYLKVKELAMFATAAGLVSVGANQGIEYYKDATAPEDYIEYVSKRHSIDEKEKEKLRGDLNFLRDNYSYYIIPYLKKGDEKALENKIQLKPTDPVIHGFEGVSIDNEKLKNLWSELFYPKGTIAGNLQGINFHKELKKTNAYGFSHTRIAEVVTFTDTINFFVNNEKEYPTKKAFVDTLDWHFSHELGHINDWVNNNNLSPKERVQFLREVTEAFDAPNSFRDGLGYVEEIKNKNTQTEKYHKVAEYWATICEYYLTFPDSISFEEKYPVEHKLIKKWFHPKDPNFDAVKSRLNREKFISEME